MDVITTVLILMEAIIALVWMDMNWNQIITLVQVTNYIAYMLYADIPWTQVVCLIRIHTGKPQVDMV